jgi:hypothetical protein
MKIRTVSLLPVLVFAASTGCKPKDCEPALAQSGEVQAALLELDLTKAKPKADDVAKAFADNSTAEIKWLASQSGRLSEAIGPMQDASIPAEERDLVKSRFDYASQLFLDARKDLRRVCE